MDTIGVPTRLGRLASGGGSVGGVGEPPRGRRVTSKCRQAARLPARTFGKNVGYRRCAGVLRPAVLHWFTLPRVVRPHLHHDVQNLAPFVEASSTLLCAYAFHYRSFIRGSRSCVRACSFFFISGRVPSTSNPDTAVWQRERFALVCTSRFIVRADSYVHTSAHPPLFPTLLLAYRALLPSTLQSPRLLDKAKTTLHSTDGVFVDCSRRNE